MEQLSVAQSFPSSDHQASDGPISPNVEAITSQRRHINFLEQPYGSYPRNEAEAWVLLTVGRLASTILVQCASHHLHLHCAYASATPIKYALHKKSSAISELARKSSLYNMCCGQSCTIIVPPFGPLTKKCAGLCPSCILIALGRRC
eukprot:scaffold91108_cov22-Tisochrysis_lutea.AAC.1